MPLMSREDSRIHDGVRDSKIQLDIPLYSRQKLASFTCGMNQAAIGENYNLEHDNSWYVRDVPRTAMGEVAGTGFGRTGHCTLTAGEIRRRIVREANKRSSSYNDRVLFEQQGRRFEQQGRRGCTIPGVLSLKFVDELPTFNGSPFMLFEWGDAIEEYFEEMNPPETLKCKIVASRLRGIARLWWKGLQDDRFMEGKNHISSWHKMRKLLISRFQPTICSTKCPLENYSGSKAIEDQVNEMIDDSITPANCSTKVSYELGIGKQNEEPSVQEEKTHNYNKPCDFPQQNDVLAERKNTQTIAQFDAIISAKSASENTPTVDERKKPMVDMVLGDKADFGISEVFGREVPVQVSKVIEHQPNNVLEAEMNTFYGSKDDVQEGSQFPIVASILPHLTKRFLEPIYATCLQSLELTYEKGCNIKLDELAWLIRVVTVLKFSLDEKARWTCLNYGECIIFKHYGIGDTLFLFDPGGSNCFHTLGVLRSRGWNKCWMSDAENGNVGLAVEQGLTVALRGSVQPVDFCIDEVIVFTFDPGGGWKIDSVGYKGHDCEVVKLKQEHKVAARSNRQPDVGVSMLLDQPKRLMELTYMLNNLNLNPTIDVCNNWRVASRLLQGATKSWKCLFLDKKKQFRLRLLREGNAESTISHCKPIMLHELAELRSQLKAPEFDISVHEFYPKKGTVVFSAWLHGLVFTLTNLAKMYASRFDLDGSKMLKGGKTDNGALHDHLHVIKWIKLIISLLKFECPSFDLDVINNLFCAILVHIYFIRKTTIHYQTLVESKSGHDLNMRDWLAKLFNGVFVPRCNIQTDIYPDLTHGRVIPWVSWNDANNASKERKLIMVEISVLNALMPLLPFKSINDFNKYTNLMMPFSTTALFGVAIDFLVLLVVTSNVVVEGKHNGLWVLRFWTTSAIKNNKAMVEYWQKYDVISFKHSTGVIEAIDKVFFDLDDTPPYCRMKMRFNITRLASGQLDTCFGVVAVSSLWAICKNRKSRESLKLFYKVVNGLDPPMDLLVNSRVSACLTFRLKWTRSWTSFLCRGMEMM